MGLLSMWIESLDYKYEILPSCTRYISPHSTCEKCVIACEKNAIYIVKGKPIINDKKCIECAFCISACPVQAVAGIYPKRTIIQNQLVISRESIPTAKELLILYRRGIKSIVGETTQLIELCNQSIEEANSILRQLGEPPLSVSVKSIDQDEYLSRRELLSLWKTEGASILKQAAPAKLRFNQEALDLQKYYKDYQFTKITIDIEKCTLCFACQKLCKKHCFTVEENSFIISPQGCSSCQLCVDACPEKAVMVANQISKKKAIKIPVHKKICTTCHKSFTTLLEHNEKCVACSMRESFFGMKEK